MEKDPEKVVNYDDIRDSLDLILSDELTSDRQKDSILNYLDDTIGSHADELWHFEDMGGPDREKLIAATSYDAERETIDVDAEGVELSLTPRLLAMGADHGIEITTDVLPEPVAAMFDVRPEEPVRIQLTVDGIERSEVHDHYDEE